MPKKKNTNKETTELHLLAQKGDSCAIYSFLMDGREKWGWEDELCAVDSEGNIPFK